MSYVKTVWETGDVITAEKLNNLEAGVESANSEKIIGTTNTTTGETSLTWNEIKAAIIAGKTVMMIFDDSEETGQLLQIPVYGTMAEDGSYIAIGIMPSTLLPAVFISTDPDDPVVLQLE